MSKDTRYEEAQAICMDCTFFFPEGDLVSENTYGLCLREYDDSLEPYIDDIMIVRIPKECRALFDKNKILGGHSCGYFESRMPEYEEHMSEPAMSEAEVLSLIIDNIDWSSQPVEKYRNPLRSSSVNIQKDAISSLGGLVAQNNTAAFDLLFDYLMSLVPSQNTDTTKLMVYILRKLYPYQNSDKLIEPLVDTLFKTESNNQTRGWYRAVFEVLAQCDLKDTEEYLIKMKESDHFSYRIKKKIDNIIERESLFY